MKIVVDIAWMKAKYKEFNEKYFGGELPDIAFETTTRASRWVGLATYTYNLGSGMVKAKKITMSNLYKSEEIVKEQTMLHEMIHIKDYSQHPEHFIKKDYSWGGYAYKKVSKREYDPHGSWFMSEAKRISDLSNGYYTVSQMFTAEERDASEISDEVKARNEKKMANGSVVCFYTLTDNPGNKGYDFGYQKSKYNIDDTFAYVNAMHHSWFSKYCYSVDYCISHSAYFASKRASGKGGYTFVPKGMSKEDFLQKYDCEVVKTYNFATKTWGSAPEVKKEETPVQTAPSKLESNEFTPLIQKYFDTIWKYVNKKLLMTDDTDVKCQLKFPNSNVALNFVISPNVEDKIENNFVYLKLDNSGYVDNDQVINSLNNALKNILKESMNEDKLRKMVRESIVNNVKKHMPVEIEDGVFEKELGDGIGEITIA